MSCNLIHGDCYDFIPTLEDKSISLIVTDPPYEFQKYGGGSLYKGTKRMETLYKLKDLDCWEFKPREFLDLIFPKMKIFNAYFFCNKMLIADYLNWANEHDLKYDLLVMNKKNPVPAFKGHHLNDLEYIILIREKGSYFDSKQPFDNYRKFFQISCSGKRLHPAEKPVELLERFVNISCPEGELVFDPFSGSGSTGIACLKSGRNFLGCEKSEEYFELADKRLKDFEDSLNGVGGLFEGIV